MRTRRATQLWFQNNTCRTRSQSVATELTHPQATQTVRGTVGTDHAAGMPRGWPPACEDSLVLHESRTEALGLIYLFNQIEGMAQVTVTF